MGFFNKRLGVDQDIAIIKLPEVDQALQLELAHAEETAG